MGRTITRYRDDDDDGGRRKSSKSAKHSRNIPGKGMRVINSWSEDDNSDDFDYEYDANTTQTQRYKGNTNGY
jgi:hypothetical protein